MTVESDKIPPAKASFFSLTFIGILLIAANLRAPITALGPVIHDIAASFHLSDASTGFLNALPLLIFGLASPFAPLLTRKLSLEKSLLAALIFIVAGCLIRSLAGSTGLWIGTLLLGIGIAAANVLVVPLIKRDFPKHTPRCVGLYAATMALTAALSSGIAAPLAQMTRASWRVSIGIWVIFAVLALAVWISVCARRGDRAETAVNPQHAGRRSLWKSAVAWQVSLFMALHTLVFYTLIDWYPSMANEHGISASAAGFQLFLYQGIAVVANLSCVLFITRLKDQRFLGLLCSLFIIAGVAGLLLLPSLSLVWLLLAGIGAGMSMVTCLTLFGLRSRDHSQAAQLSGKAQCVGYLIGALGPWLAGLLHSQTHTWSLVLISLLLLSSAQAYFAWQAGRNRFV